MKNKYVLVWILMNNKVGTSNFDLDILAGTLESKVQTFFKQNRGFGFKKSVESVEYFEYF